MSARARNPGPSWGYQFLRTAERLLPAPVFRGGFRVGTAISVPLLPTRAWASREYLTALRGHRPARGEVYRHFQTFADFLCLRFRVAEGAPHTCFLDSNHAADFLDLARASDPALFGTFHLGHSDLLGFWLADFQRRVRMIRLQVGNSDDVAWLHRRFAPYIDFLYVNRPEDILNGLREAVEQGWSLALKCDRLGHSARTEVFEFLGQRRRFPFTIYHLAHIFDLPVVLSFGLPDGPDRTRVFAVPTYRPVRGPRGTDRWAAAREHFQEALRLVESLLREQPYAWFNFGPLNPEEKT